MYHCIRCGGCCKNHLWLITFSDLREIHHNYPDLPVLRDKDRICPFLQPNTMDCIIYPHRPMLCRKFPYERDRSEEFIFQKSQCPGRGELSEDALEEINLLISEVWASYETFQQEIRVWNKVYQQNLSNLAFLTYILNLNSPS